MSTDYGPHSEVKYFVTQEARNAGLRPPVRAYEQDAGIDLRVAAAVTIAAGGRAEVPTGLGFELPIGSFGLICNRTSGGRRGLLPLGHVVDSGYRGEIVLIMQNLNPDQALDLEFNERVAQMVVMPCVLGPLVNVEVSSMTSTERGQGRFGSSGKG